MTKGVFERVGQQGCSQQTLADEVAATWEDDCKRHHAKTDWQFTTADARIKLKWLYPAF